MNFLPFCFGKSLPGYDSNYFSKKVTRNLTLSVDLGIH